MTLKQKSDNKSYDNNCTNVSIPDINLQETKFRFLCPSDVPEVGNSIILVKFCAFHPNALTTILFI